MINDTFGIVTVLLFIEGAIFYLSEHRATAKLFDYLPSMFWIYFLPMIASTVHLIPQKNEVYQFISSNFLPASLLLLLISVDIRGILKLGKVAILMMLAGSGDRAGRAGGAADIQALASGGDLVGVWGIVGLVDGREREYAGRQGGAGNPGKDFFADGGGRYDCAVCVDGISYRSFGISGGIRPVEPVRYRLDGKFE